MKIYKISSLDNPLIKSSIRLREDPKERALQKGILVTGRRLIEEIRVTTPILRLFATHITETFDAEEVYEISEPLFKKLTGLVTPPSGEEALVAHFPLPPPSSLQKISSVLVLDSLSDPGNVGALLRTALALGWGGVFFVTGTVDPFHEKVIRASRASLFRLPYCVGDYQALETLKKSGNFVCYLADTKGVAAEEVVATSPLLLIVGNEGRGLSKEVHALGERITIPMQGAMESLNVSIAGALLMYILGGLRGA